MTLSSWKNFLIRWVCPKPPKTPKHSPQNILIVSTTGLGDTIWALPAIENVRQKLPDTKISFLTTSMGKTLFSQEKNIDQIFIYENFVTTWKKLKRHSFDTIFIFHASQRAIFPLVAFLKPKILVSTKGKNKNLDFLFSHLAPNRKCHEVVRRLDLLRELQIPIQWHPPKLSLLSNVVTQHSVLLHPGAKDRYKCWPLEYWSQLAHDLIEKFSLNVVISGTKEEQKDLEKIYQSEPRVQLFIGQSISKLIKLIQEQKLIITNDTGPLHLAAALDKPVIGIYAATNPFFCGPFLAKQAYLLARQRPCTPCLKRSCPDPFCMRQIGKNEVLEIVKNVCK